MINNKHNYIWQTVIGYFLGNIHVIKNMKDELVKRLACLLRNSSKRRLLVIFITAFLVLATVRAIII